MPGRSTPVFMRSLPLLASLAALPPTAHAAEDIQWNGFLNVVGGIMHHEPYSADNPDGELPSRVGYTDDFSFDRETSAGLQAARQIDETTRITAQLYANGAEDNYAATMKWLYLTWQSSDESYLRVGKLGAPIYYYTDFLNIGYTYPWISPPRELYQFDTTFTGLSWTYANEAGGLDWSAEMFGGSSEQYIATVQAQTSTDNIRGLVLSLTDNEWVNLRFMEMRQRFTLDSDVLDPDALIDVAFESAVSDGLVSQATADALRPSLEPQIRPFVTGAIPIENARMIYREFAARLERQAWFMMYETSQYLTDTYVYSDTRGWYLSGGYKTGPVTWHLTRSKRDTPLNRKAIADWEFSQTPLSGVPFARLPEYLGSSINSRVAIRSAVNLRAWTAGATLDVSANAVLKFEVVRFETVESVPDETLDTGSNTLFRTALCVTF